MVTQEHFCYSFADVDDDTDDAMRIVVMVDRSCCEGCRARICRSLKRIPGVAGASFGEDRSLLTVVGQLIDEDEVLRRVKERKSTARILEVHIPLKSGKPNYVAEKEAAKAKSKSNLATEGDQKAKSKWNLATEGGQKGKGGDTAAAAREGGKGGGKERGEMMAKQGDTLVTERSHVAMSGGVTIRTRVTTTHDACTCLVVEETLFRIDRLAAAPAAASTSS